MLATMSKTSDAVWLCWSASIAVMMRDQSFTIGRRVLSESGSLHKQLVSVGLSSTSHECHHDHDTLQACLFVSRRTDPGLV